MGKFRSSYVNRKVLQLGNQVNVVLTGKWLFICILVGMIAGFSALAFAFALDTLLHFSLKDLAGYNFPIPAGESDQIIPFDLSEALHVKNVWWIIFLPAIGAGLAGFLTKRFAPEAAGGGVDSVVKSFHFNKGYIRARVPFVKFIASVLTVGTGGSAGREGPIAQISGGIASFLASKLNLSEKERKIVLIAGMGAGIGAIFQSPIGGAIYSAEVLYKKDIESEGLMPSIIASIIAYSIFSSMSGWKTVFRFEAVRFEEPTEFPLYILLSILLTLTAIVYTRSFKFIKNSFFEKMMINDYYKPVIGGLMVGLIATQFPPILESSYGYLQEGLHGNLPVWFMLALAFLKILTTSLTVKSGASGGVFAPTMVIGGLLGGAFGLGIEQWFPGLISDPKGFILVGMAAFFASVEKVPIAATIIITEMSGSYELIVPLIFASAISFIGSQSWSLYDVQIDTKLDSPSYRGEFLNDAMESVKVRSAFKPIKNMPILSVYDDINSILKVFTDSELLVLPVKNKSDELVGLITLNDLRLLLNEQSEPGLIVAADIMTRLNILHLNDPISMAFKIFKQTNLPEIPVLAHGSPNVVIGVLTERNFLIAYERSLSEQTSEY
ncbi:chloride channel protein [bacterium]|nr:MAG: chloride channel protein [bacterium]